MSHRGRIWNFKIGKQNFLREVELEANKNDHKYEGTDVPHHHRRVRKLTLAHMGGG